MNAAEQAKSTIKAAFPIFLGVLAALLVAQQLD